MTSSLTLFMISALSEGAPLLLVVCCALWIQLTGALSREEPIFADKFQARDYSTSQHNILHIYFAEAFKDFLFQDKKFVHSVLDKINADNLRSFLKTLSREPHIATSERDR
jgi:hypothetical protein